MWAGRRGKSAGDGGKSGADEGVWRGYEGAVDPRQGMHRRCAGGYTGDTQSCGGAAAVFRGIDIDAQWWEL